MIDKEKIVEVLVSQGFVRTVANETAEHWRSPHGDIVMLSWSQQAA